MSMKTKAGYARKERVGALGAEGLPGASRWLLVPVILLLVFAR
jgi:uncharacterized membrane protein YqhA